MHDLNTAPFEKKRLRKNSSPVLTCRGLRFVATISQIAMCSCFLGETVIGVYMGTGMAIRTDMQDYRLCGTAWRGSYRIMRRPDNLRQLTRGERNARKPRDADAAAVCVCCRCRIETNSGIRNATTRQHLFTSSTHFCPNNDTIISRIRRFSHMCYLFRPSSHGMPFGEEES